MKLIERMKNLNIFEMLFKSPRSETPAQQEPAPVPVEEIKFPESLRRADVVPHLVIDFGTTATVVGEVRITFRDLNKVNLDLLVGRSEFESAMSIDANGKVSAVGPTAYTDSKSKPGHLYVTSMKRYLELASRSSGASFDFQNIVRNFLKQAMGEEYRTRAPLGPNSEIVISVPNSFNPRAVEDLQRGVVYAINDLNNSRESTIDFHNVKIARESEAVAYLYVRKKDLPSAPTMEEQEPEAPFIWDSLHSASRKLDGPERIIVLDVGGGTTDLSLVEVDGQNPNAQIFRVVLNAGIALGGTDVDKLLFRGLFDKKADPAKVFKDWPIDQRIDLLNRIRAAKDSDADRIFEIPDADKPDGFRKTLSEWLTQVPEAVRRFSPGDHECSEEDTNTYRAEAGRRLTKLIRLSVTGLFDLIHEIAKDGVSRILLTGRASRLGGVRAAVIEQAKKLNADVEYLRHRYHAKLVVAYGCALIRNSEFSGSRLPTETLGRTLQVKSNSTGLFASFEADFPVSGDAPTLFQARLPGHPDHPGTYIIGEFKTDVAPDFFDETNDWPAGSSTDFMEWLGCGRAIAKWDLRAGYPPKGMATRFLLWHPVTETYYSIDKEQWSDRRPQRPFSWSDLNYVTGLPLGFPYEGLEHKLGSETETGREE